MPTAQYTMLAHKKPKTTLYGTRSADVGSTYADTGKYRLSRCL